MRKLTNLCFAGAIFILLVGLFYWEAQYFIGRSLLLGKALNYQTQKAQAALVIVSFHSYYHVWPSAEGPLNMRALDELSGDGDARINTKHINFFDKYHSPMILVDPDGNFMRCKYDDIIGTCVVTGSKHWDEFLNPKTNGP